MGSSDQDVSYQNLETASTIQTETVTGSHLFTVCRYSLTKGIGVGTCFNSDVFTVGGYKWMIEYYPDGYDNDDKEFIAFYLVCKIKDSNVKAQFSFTMLQQNDAPSNISYTSGVRTFSSTTGSWGYRQFKKRTEFETSGYLKDDTFTIKCTVTIIKDHHLKVIGNYGFSVPPSNLKQNLANLLDTGKGADVTFVVKGERFNAHRCVLAARSAVFSAELLGCMKEKLTDSITVDDIEAPVFKSMLHFMYTDSVPDFEEPTGDDDDKQNPRLMAQHLFITADRYQLERLKLMCGNLLCKNLSASNAATTLILAERYNCGELKAPCLRFMSAPEIFKAVVLTDPGFQDLMKISPSILKEIS